ncbi:MAG: hypothetical protein ACT443_10910 [Gemmatimonadota bacterium]
MASGAAHGLGDESGSLEQALAALAAHFKAVHRLLNKLWSKLTYPLIPSLALHQAETWVRCPICVGSLA